MSTVSKMLMLMAVGFGLLFYGRRVTTQNLYPKGRPEGERWPVRQILASMPMWEQDRVAIVIGGLALQFAGIIIIIGSFSL
jgi:hypothetical protein